MELDDITGEVIGASIRIHRDLGPGLLESVYELVLAALLPNKLLTYLRLTNLHVGLLLNFGAGTMKEGLERVVNDLPPCAFPRLRVNHLSQ